MWGIGFAAFCDTVAICTRQIPGMGSWEWDSGNNGGPHATTNIGGELKAYNVMACMHPWPPRKGHSVLDQF